MTRMVRKISNTGRTWLLQGLGWYLSALLTDLDPSININIYSDQMRNTTVRETNLIQSNANVVEQTYTIPGGPIWGG